jgi:SPP1 gp7 family putative phage head morphogenesis protein
MFDFTRLSNSDLVYLGKEADDMNKLEKGFLRAYQKYLEQYEEQIFRCIAHHDRPEPVVDLLPFVIEQVGKILRRGMYDKPKKARLASVAKIPHDLPTLRKWYDAMRKRPSKKIKHIANKLKKNYLDRIQETWKTASADWRQGKQWNQEEIRKHIREAAEVAVVRSKVIAATETTRYYNQARRERYDVVKQVEAYLFMAIRDKRTTAWCKDRHGLVYEKGDKYLDKETPPCHWSCRSQILPLVRTNPFHKKLLADESLRRENHKCEPLPKGWNE